MRVQTQLLIAVLAVMLIGFGATLSRMTAVAVSVRSLENERQVELTSGKHPLEVNMQTQPCVTMKKTVDEIEIEYMCYRMPNETSEEFGQRCMQEFKAFCKGLEGGG